MKKTGLCDAAKAASKNSYSPYSKFPVGAAVESEKGVFTGCNVENASYGLSVCAERSAIFAAVVAGARKIKRIAVYNPRKMPYPCGACLQVIGEFSSDDIEILISSKKQTESYRLSELLPQRFTL
jgi:cytidine deaminase